MVGALHTGEPGLTLNSLICTLDATVDVVVLVGAGVAEVVGASSVVVVVVGIDEEDVVVVEGTVALCPLPHPASETSARTGERRTARRPMNGGYARTRLRILVGNVWVRRYRAEQREGR
jgi:hypothetical protein